MRSPRVGDVGKAGTLGCSKGEGPLGSSSVARGLPAAPLPGFICLPDSPDYDGDLRAVCWPRGRKPVPRRCPIVRCQGLRPVREAGPNPAILQCRHDLKNFCPRGVVASVAACTSVSSPQRGQYNTVRRGSWARTFLLSHDASHSRLFALANPSRSRLNASAGKQVPPGN